MGRLRDLDHPVDVAEYNLTGMGIYGGGGSGGGGGGGGAGEERDALLKRDDARALRRAGAAGPGARKPGPGVVESSTSLHPLSSHV